jgi:hypothetical protein
LKICKCNMWWQEVAHIYCDQWCKSLGGKLARSCSTIQLYIPHSQLRKPKI